MTEIFILIYHAETKYMSMVEGKSEINHALTLYFFEKQ